MHERDRAQGARWWPGIAPLLLALVAAGCASPSTRAPAGDTRPPTAVAPSSQRSLSDHAVPPIVLRDPLPGQLDVQFSLTIDGETAGTPVTDEIGLSILSAGKNVQFAGSEHLSCDDRNLLQPGGVVTGLIVRAPAAQVAGATIACEYTAAGATARFALRIPAAPAITSPAAGAQVARSHQTLVTYEADPAAGIVMGVVALAPGSTMPKTWANINRPGPGQATLDTSGFAAVPGTLVLSVDLTPTVSVAGTTFRTLKAFGMANIAQAVAWT
jgi:hypothetical protein